MSTVFKKFRHATSAVAFAMAVVFGSLAAQAATLSQYEAVAGGANISGSGNATLSSTGIGFIGGPGLATGGSIAAPTLVNINSFNLFAAGPTIAGGSFFSNVFIPSPVPTVLPYLTGVLEDAKADSGALSFLFSVTGGSAASDFGSHVIYTLNNPAFNAGTFLSLPQILPPSTQSVSSVAFTIQQAQVVPVPATLPLMLAGLGAFVWIRRRRQCA